MITGVRASVRWCLWLLAVMASGCAASIPKDVGVPVYRAPLDAAPPGRAMPSGCRLVAATSPVSITELEIESQKDPYRVQRDQAAAAGANALLVLSRVEVPRRDPNCPPSSRITDCPFSSGAWYRVVFESYACTADALKTLSTPAAKTGLLTAPVLHPSAHVAR